MGTAVGLSSDLSTGVINRFRTLPMARSAILAGRTLSDLLASMLCATIVLITGLVIGWRPDNGLAGVVAGLAVAVLFAYALSWFMACIGLLGERPRVGAGAWACWSCSRSPSCRAPGADRRGCPTGCGHRRVEPGLGRGRFVPRAVRQPQPGRAVGMRFRRSTRYWWRSCWSIVIIAVCAPVASRILRKRTTD